MQQELESLGLTSNDARIYIALLELRESSAGEIIKKTGFHRNIVYESLDRLINKRLVFKKLQQKVPRYQLADPSRLLEDARGKLAIAEELAEKIRERGNVRSDIVIYDGIEGFRTYWLNHVNRMTHGDTYYVIGSLGNLWNELLGDQLTKIHRLMIKKEIKIKVIAYEKSKKDDQLLKLLPSYEVRLMPNGYQTPANVNIWQDHSALQTAVEPYSVIDIYNPVLAKSYLNTFNSLWAAAKEYK